MAGENASMQPGIEVILQMEVETKKSHLVRQGDSNEKERPKDL